MLIREIMTEAPEVVAPDDTIADAARRMRDLDVGSLPVCDGEKLVGMVTDRDIAVRAVADGRDAEDTCVCDVMTPEVVSLRVDDDIERARELMEERQVRRLPVLDEQKRLVGVVALGDLATRYGEDDQLASDVLERVSEPNVPG